MSRDRFRNQLSSRISGSDFDPDEEPSSSGGGGLFLWTVILLLLVGLAMFTWIGSYYTFGHPEKPLFYSVLTKLKKLDPPKRFELTAAPRGEFLRPQQIFERFGKLTPRELTAENEKLLRNYLRNYKLTQELVPYVVGTYNILDSFDLASPDLFQSGVVAVAQAKESPGVLLEQVFPAEKKVLPTLQRTLLTGLDIDLKRENELSAVIHVEKLDDGRVKVTAVSLLYPGYGSTVAPGTFSLEPPAILNVEAGLPITTTRRQKDADQKYKSYRARAGLTKPPHARRASGRRQQGRPAPGSRAFRKPDSSPSASGGSGKARAHTDPGGRSRALRSDSRAGKSHSVSGGNPLSRGNRWSLADVCARANAARPPSQRAGHAGTGRERTWRRSPLPPGELSGHGFR